MGLKSARDVQSEFRKRSLPENFCHVPFTSLIFEPDGLVGSCRQKGSEFSVGSLRSQTFQEIWNGPFLRQWRREFLAGEPKICRSEVRHEGCNLCPEYNRLLAYTVPEEVQAGPPLRLGLNLNGKCNLRCRMCHIWKKPNGLYDHPEFWRTLEELIPTLREVELFSGEPFIQKDTFRLIEIFRERNPDCLWSITTNGNWDLTDAIRQALDQIPFKNLVVSIDSLNPETYAKIRRDGDLALLLRNFDDLLRYEKSRLERGLTSLRIKVLPLIQKDNWMEVPELLAFGERTGTEVTFSFLTQPMEHSLLTLPEADRERIIDHYAENLSPHQLRRSMRVILPIVDSLSPLSNRSCWLRVSEKLSA